MLKQSFLTLSLLSAVLSNAAYAEQSIDVAAIIPHGSNVDPRYKAKNYTFSYCSGTCKSETLLGTVSEDYYGSLSQAPGKVLTSIDQLAAGVTIRVSVSDKLNDIVIDTIGSDLKGSYVSKALVMPVNGKLIIHFDPLNSDEWLKTS